ncbi:MAG TPA: hypothetical protein VG891_11865 [Rhizomicrobium sp.]|nr:hypothetical protein [Rhizomicrobium sp.]
MTEEARMRAGANPAELVPPMPTELPADVTNPNITEMLLNAQLVECLTILRGAAYLYREEPHQPYERGQFVNHATSLVKASVKIAAMVHRLKHGEEERPTIHQKFTVERIVRTAGGEGEVQIPKND